MIAVDLFAGWGGFTAGAERAGVRVAYAANHWPVAVRAHAANHPHVEHVCQDLRQADWTRLPAHDILLASPACQGHSTAAQPRRTGVAARRHDALRATAWAVVDCVEVCRPRALLVENVPAFRRWALYGLWCDALRTLGYRVEDRTLRASHHGTPQRRDRVFVVGTLGDREVPQLVRRPEPAFGPCIEWDAVAQWHMVDRARAGVRTRILAGRERLGVPRYLSQHTTGHRGVPLDEPIRTITTKDHWVVVDGSRYRSLTIREYARAMGFRDDRKWPASVGRTATIMGIGNAVCPELAMEMVAATVDAIA